MNTRCKKILVPVDGSQNSFSALAHAANLATALNATVDILYVRMQARPLPIADQIGSIELPEMILDHGEEFASIILEKAAKEIPESIKVQTFCEAGEPAIVITEFAEEKAYDFIIIGSRGLGVFKGLFMGSVSNYVVNHAKCPVLIVK